jgi:hypothetical protein
LATVTELAAFEGLNSSYVAHVLRLMLLAPDIVEAVLDGRQPKTMQLQTLIRAILTFGMISGCRSLERPLL